MNLQYVAHLRPFVCNFFCSFCLSEKFVFFRECVSIRMNMVSLMPLHVGKGEYFGLDSFVHVVCSERL